jgi:hypothetical protein
MTLDEIIKLCEDIEAGNFGQRIGFHLHRPLNKATSGDWRTNDSYSDRFSGFLKALKDAEAPDHD